MAAQVWAGGSWQQEPEKVFHYDLCSARSSAESGQEKHWGLENKDKVAWESGKTGDHREPLGSVQGCGGPQPHPAAWRVGGSLAKS